MTRKQQISAGGRDLTVSNLAKVLFPESGFTKGEVIGYYSGVAEWLLPHLRDRPLTLKRYPEGVNGEHFYEKNAPVHTPAWVKRFAVERSEGGAPIRYILCNDLPTLVWVTNLGDIEKHVLLARAPHLNRPTSIVFDLDPGEPAGLLDCSEIALHLRSVLQAMKLESFVKVSGSKGLHLSVPLNTATSYEVTQPFAKAIAQLVERQMPDRVVADMAKTLRRGKVLIDWSQNSDFKTTVCVYALRAKRGVPFVSLPVRWDELSKAVKKRDEQSLFFTPAAALKRLRKAGDLFAEVLTLKQKLPAHFTQALAVGPAPKLSRWPRNQKNPRDKSLREYAAKRDHTRTPEPAARPLHEDAKDGKVHRFVIQKHDASHLHFDWRLEMQGVLRSWAVPKGPPMKLREARLAMHVEDHPLEYASFEGTIPVGNYGAGTVMVWDEGEYEDLTGNAATAFHQGKMHVVMRGKKLKGEWILVKDRREEEGNRWLLIKAGQPLTLSVKALSTSAVSGRTMEQIAKANDRQWQSNRPEPKPVRRRSITVRSSEPGFVQPMQCKPVAELPEGEEWNFEIKFDGYRCLAVKDGDSVALYSRNEKKLNARFPEVVKGLAALPGDFVLDGELVALDERGRPSFQLLQNSESARPAVQFYAFDFLHDGEEGFLEAAIEQRRERLTELLSGASDPLRLSPLLDGSGEQILSAVKELGLEGVVGKRAGSKYEPGERSGAWIKHRTDRQQEFVIGGFVPGTRGFYSLLVGVHAQGRLHYVAKVKDGFVPRLRDDIFPKLKQLTAARCPFANLPETKAARWGEALMAEKMKECRWVKPRLVCQVAFVEWTDGGKLRHCKFIAMRDDKKPAEVGRET